jgi:hypothetical protein
VNSSNKPLLVGNDAADFHREASGNPPPEPQPLTAEWAPLPLSDMHWGVVDGFTNGIHHRINEETGRHEARAWAIAMTDREQFLESPVYGLVLEADEKPVTPPAPRSAQITVRDHLGASTEGLVRAAVARSHMKPDERSGLDMIYEARTLQAEARRIEAKWKAEQDRLAEEKRLDDEAVALYHMWQRGKALVEKAKKQS